MKRIYLIRKDPGKEGKDNWMTLGAGAFREYLKTEEGRARELRFARLDACSERDAILYVECSGELMKKLKRESDRKAYLRKRKEELGIRFVRPEDTGEIRTQRDEGPDEILSRKEEREMLRAAVGKLRERDRVLIRSLYLAERPVRLGEYAERHSITLSAACRRRARALERLREILREETEDGLPLEKRAA